MKRPDLVVLIAVWMFLSAFGVLIGIGALASAFFFTAPWMTVWGWNGWEMWGAPNISGFIIFGLGVAVLVMAAYFILALMGGIGLLQGKGWGRILSIVHAALSLFWIPVGTVIGILILVYLTRPEVVEYFAGGGEG